MLGAGLLLALSRTQIRPSRPTGERRGRLEVKWTLVFGTFIAAATAQVSVLNRADSSHLLNCYAIFPIFLTLFLVWTAADVKGPHLKIRVPIGLLIVAAAVFAVNRGTPEYAFPTEIAGRAATALVARTAETPDLPTGLNARLDAPLKASDPAFANLSNMTLGEAETLIQALRERAGPQPIYIDPSLADFSAFGPFLGYWYFAANLKPVEVPYEEDSLVITEVQRQGNLTALRDPETAICSLATVDSNSEESQAVLARLGKVRFSEIMVKGIAVRIYSCA
jgi:hypothetical protein